MDRLRDLLASSHWQVDIDRIRAENADRTDVERKSGLIIWSGPNPNKKMRDEWRKEAQSRFGLSKDELKDVDELLDEVTAKLDHIKPQGQSQSVGIPLISLLESDSDDLPRDQKLALLKQLRSALQLLHQQLLAAEPGPSQQGNQCHQSLQPPETSAECASVDEGDDGDAILPVRMLISNKASKGPACQIGRQGAASENKPSKSAGKRKSMPEAESCTQARHPRNALTRERHKRSRFAISSGAPEKGENLSAAEVAFAPLEADVAQLQGMGFSASKAKEALQETHHDVEAAIEWLVANCV